jgi:thymidylate synthase (FAD)
MDADPKHDSPIEHALYTWRISGVSRALSHQLVRHRIASYSQRSQRYCNEKQFEYVTPSSITDKEDCLLVYDNFMRLAQRTYDYLHKHGVLKEDARFILPNACATSLIVSMNPRAFRNFLKLRLDTHAQWEIRALAKLLLDSIPDDHKFMYEDLI